jgi:hypothetical protein
MRAVRIVVASPAFDEDLGFAQRIEEFPVQRLIPQLPVKGLDIGVILQRQRLCTLGTRPRHVLRVIGPYVHALPVDVQVYAPHGPGRLQA